MTVSFELVNTGNTQGDCIIVKDVKTGRELPIGRGGVLRLGSGEITINVTPKHGNGAWRGEIESYTRERQERLDEQDML